MKTILLKTKRGTIKLRSWLNYDLLKSGFASPAARPYHIVSLNFFLAISSLSNLQKVASTLLLIGWLVGL